MNRLSWIVMLRVSYLPPTFEPVFSATNKIAIRFVLVGGKTRNIANHWLLLQHWCKTSCTFFVVHFTVSCLSFKFSQECSPLRVYINPTFTLYLVPWALLSLLLLLKLRKRFIQKHGWLSCSVLGRRVAELELYILVCKVCVVGVFMRNVSLSDPFKYFSRTLDLVFTTTRTRGRELIAFLYVRLLHSFFFPTFGS